MLRFYHGLSLETLEAMDSEKAEQFWIAMTVIEAQEAIVATKISDFPSMKDEARRKFFKDLNRAASPDILKPEPIKMSAKDFADLVNG